MEFLRNLIKALIILAMIVVMEIPFLLEFYTFKRDKAKKISYKRFRLVVFTAVYLIAVTVALFLLKDFLLWLETTSFVQWFVAKIALSAYSVYFGQIIVVVLVNFAIGILYRFFSKFVRIGLKKKNLTVPKKKDGEFNWRQKAERKIISFFHTETWFFVAKILKYLNLILSAAYIFIFVLYFIPALYSADWIPYDFISMLFHAGYLYPSITLLGLWEMYFFLEGIRDLEKECPELLKKEVPEEKEKPLDLLALDQEIRKQFNNYYLCDVDVSDAVQEKIPSLDHHKITKYIAKAVENDRRNPQKNKEVYLDCLDRIAGTEKSVLINGNFFSEFSMYFLRNLSIILSRGDNVIFVCNSDLQIESVSDYLTKGLSQLSSLYCEKFENDSVDFDDPIWRIVKISEEHSMFEETSVDDSNILITSLSYLCSDQFEQEHSRFVTFVDIVVFVDTLNTVNLFNRQLAILNTRLQHIEKNNVRFLKNGNVNETFRLRYISRQFRYLCFDDTRTPGLDKILKNMLSVDFDSVDAMNYNRDTLVRCYCYEGKPDEDGRSICPQFLPGEEEIGVMVNMAILCLAKGAARVNLFTGDGIPYQNIEETIAANAGQISITVNENNLQFNQPYYNPNDYSVILAMDVKNDLPAALRKYLSMASDKPTLVIVFAKPYLLRDYYAGNMDRLWRYHQLERIPVEGGTIKDTAQKILVRANEGGISKNEILRLATGIPQFEEYVAKQDTNGILREVLAVYGIPQEERINLFQTFEYFTIHDFDEKGNYRSEERVLLRRKGSLFNAINGRDMVVMATGEREVILPIPRSRMTQNYIAGQNILHNGNIYHIQKIDTENGKIYARLAVGGKNDEAYQYLPAREYRVELNFKQLEYVFPQKHVVINQQEENIAVDDVYISVFRAPMEVLTKGYYEIDPHTFAKNAKESKYHSIIDADHDLLAKQTYRRYGDFEQPAYSSDGVMEETNLVASKEDALMMSLRVCGQFSADVDKAMELAAVMLNEMICSMFPSVSDSVVVCPVLHQGFSDEESQIVLQKQPRLTIVNQDDASPNTENHDFELLILEDCATDLGVISVLMSAGNDLLHTLFAPIFQYLSWYFSAEEKSDYLYYGLEHEPNCFDFSSLYQLAKILGDDKYDLKYVDVDTVVEYRTCDFCGRRYDKGNNVVELDDGRNMCAACGQNLVGNNKKALKEHLNRAKIFLESTYGITVGEDYKFCFESTLKITNTLKQNRNDITRGADTFLKSYVDDKKQVHIEYSIPAVNLSELLVRELTHVWQLNHLPNLEKGLAEGHIALVAIQYLKFLNQDALVAARTKYYESTSNPAGEGYRRLVHELLANPKFHNNPFRYLLEVSGTAVSEEITGPYHPESETEDFGLPYTPESFDRALDGQVEYFYYSHSTPSQQALYDVLLNAIQMHEEKVTVDGYSAQEIRTMTWAVVYDHPELFWFDRFCLGEGEVEFIYGATKEESAQLQQRMEASIAKYLEGIDDSMSAYDAAIRIYVRVIQTVDYDTVSLKKQKQNGGEKAGEIDTLRTICGVFLNQKAVCEGYARAVQYLLQKCGIECAEAAGTIQKEDGETGGGHAWNLLKIDGEYYHLDATWDDSSDTIQSVKKTDFGFDYFCVTTEEILRTRSMELCPIKLPECRATRGNYYYHNNFVMEHYSIDWLKDLAEKAVKNKNSSFIFKCKTKTVFEQALHRLCDNGEDCYEVLKFAQKADRKLSSSSYSYRYDKNIWTITILFKYR